MELDARLSDAYFVHVVCVREREGAVEVTNTALLHDVARGFGTVALDVDEQVPDVNLPIAAVVYVGIDLSDGQFPALFPAHLGSTRLGDVEAEISLTGDVAKVIQFHDMA